jgi:hypothetical protein
MYKISRERRQLIVSPFRPSVFDDDILPLNVARCIQALAEGNHIRV